MALRSAGCICRTQLQRLGGQLQQQSSTGPGHTLRMQLCSSSSGPAAGGVQRIKKPEQMTDEELKQSLPSMLFTTSNLIWSTTLAVGVAAAGLMAMFWVGTFITGAAKSLKHLEEPAQQPPPAPPKSLAQLITERKAELESQLAELQQLPRSLEAKQAIAAVRKELRQYRDPNTPWWRWW